MEYGDKVLLFLRNDLKHGQKINISGLTNNPDLLISTVKQLINEKCVDDIEFANDYSYIRRMWNMNPPENDKIRLQCIMKDITRKNKI